MILLLTHSGDYFTIDKVVEALEEQGARFTRLDTNRIPFECPILINYKAEQMPRITFVIDEDVLELRADQVRSVWLRRLWPGQFPDDFPPELAASSAPACSTAVIDALSLFEQAHWVNPLLEGQRAESKLWQLSLASEFGLRVPETLVTNHPQQVKEFFELHKGRIITKLLVPQAVSMEASENFAYTCLIQAEHLDHLEHVRAQPQIFQPFLDKEREFRVVVVGETVFVGALEIPKSGPASVDWRQATEKDKMGWEHGELPESLVPKILEMMDVMNLRFGVFDFVDTGEGDPYFLEVNPAGEWGMLERDLEHPIARQIALELCQ